MEQNDTAKMKRAIISAVRQLGSEGLGVPFSYLHDEIEGLWESQYHATQRTLLAEPNNNVCVWIGFTQMGIQAFLEIFSEGLLTIRPCESRHYPKSLYRPPYPVVSMDDLNKSLPDLSWLPVLLYTPENAPR